MRRSHRGKHEEMTSDFTKWELFLMRKVAFITFVVVASGLIIFVRTPSMSNLWLTGLVAFVIGLFYGLVAILAGLVVGEWIDNWAWKRAIHRVAEQHLADIHRQWERGRYDSEG